MHLKHTLLTASLLLVMQLNSLASTYATTEADGNRIVTGVTFDLRSRYDWRGLAWSEGPVFQPSFGFGKETVNISIWGNFVLDREANQGQFNEIDYTLQSKHSFGAFDLTGNFYYYQYPHQEDSPATGELELICSYSLSCCEFSLTKYC